MGYFMLLQELLYFLRFDYDVMIMFNEETLLWLVWFSGLSTSLQIERLLV